MGVTERLSLGSGKEVMPYLKEGSETTLSLNLALTEFGNMGHIVPGHNYLLELVRNNYNCHYMTFMTAVHTCMMYTSY